MDAVTITNIGAAIGVTGSCHWVHTPNWQVLVDCGLFQGDETRLRQPFPFDPTLLDALLITHVHIDHIGRVPELILAGFEGAIWCSVPSAQLMIEVISDAVRVAGIYSPNEVAQVLKRLKRQIKACDYKTRCSLFNHHELAVEFLPAGHILGSASITLHTEVGRLAFSGDVGMYDSPLLVDPVSPQAEVLVIESTYGDRNHKDRTRRLELLESIIDKTLENKGTTLIPAFSIGRTQELLYELEAILSKPSNQPRWARLPIIVDSPLANRFTKHYRALSKYWDAEAKHLISSGRHPLDFEQFVTVNRHAEHISIVNRLAQRHESAVVIAASGMCEGGRMLNYLDALVDEPSTDIVFVGYQARGTLGAKLQRARRGDTVRVAQTKKKLAAKCHTLQGYSAHADQMALLRYISNMTKQLKHVHIVHGEPTVQRSFAAVIKRQFPDLIVSCAADSASVKFS